jgi:1,4-alpha-glucan branching enzyme
LYKYEITDANGKLLPLKADPYGALHEPPPGNSSIVFQSAFQWSDNDWRDRQRSGPKLDAPTSIYEVQYPTPPTWDSLILNSCP